MGDGPDPGDGFVRFSILAGSFSSTSHTCIFSWLFSFVVDKLTLFSTSRCMQDGILALAVVVHPKLKEQEPGP